MKRFTSGLAVPALLALASAVVAQSTNPLRIICPPNQTNWICGVSSFAFVSYPAPATTGSCSAIATVTCTPPSGSAFALGTTTVSCRATNSCRESATCTFTVTVARDVTPPAITCPGNISVVACSASGTVVNYSTPTAKDNADPDVAVTCSPASGSLFPVGTTTVTCTAIDDCTNRATCTFLVRVTRDTTPPVIQCPTNFTVWTCSPTGEVVNFPAPIATDNLDATPTVVCSPPSGSVFPLGTHTVTCTATDECTNRIVCAFTVTVRAPLSYGGLCHTPLGLATLNVNTNGELEVAGFGASGQDGVRIDLGESQGLNFSYRNAPGLNNGDLAIQILARNTAGQEFPAVRLLQHYEGGKVSVEPSYASYEWKLLLRGEEVYRRGGASGPAPPICWFEVHHEVCEELDVPNFFCFHGCWYVFAPECPVETESGPILADTMVITPETPGTPFTAITAVQFLGKNIPGIALEDERLMMFGRRSQLPLRHRALGEARLIAENGTLTMAELGSSGEDGVGINFASKGSTAENDGGVCDGYMDDDLPPWVIDPGIEFEITARTSLSATCQDSLLGSLTLSALSTTSAQVDIQGRPCESWLPPTVTVFNAGQPVGGAILTGSGPLATLEPAGTGRLRLIGSASLPSHALGFMLHFSGPCVFTLRNGARLTGDEIRVLADTALPGVADLASVELVSRGLKSFKITEEQPLAALHAACPPSLTVRSCSTNPVPVNFPPPVVTGGSCTLPATVVCVPPSGSVFPPGTTTVQCTVTNACGERAVCNFTVTVLADTAPPVIQCPSDILLWTCSTSAITHYSVTATDDSDTNVTITCTPPVGTPLPVGDTTVTCVATDDCGKTSACSFQVRVIRDTTPPQITCPTNMVFNHLCPGQVIALDFFQAMATDDHDPNPSVVCDPPSLVSSPGVHVITCTATDHCGNSNRCQFTVTFNYDTTPPLVTCPTNVSVRATGPDGAIVCYMPPAVTDDMDPNARAKCVPPPGSLFPVGTTPVVCTALDACGNRQACTFLVDVVLLKVHVAYSRSGLIMTWPGDATLETADDVVGPWSPIRGATSPYPVPAVGAKKFFRLSENPACCGGIVNDPGEIAYVSVGLTPLFGEDGAAGMPMLRMAQDDDTSGGAILLAAGAGGGLEKNCWSEVVNIPFPFRFYGEPFTQFCVSKHGLLTFSTAVAGQSIPTTPLSLDVNWPMPNQYYPADTIACFHGRFQPLQSGQDVRAWLYGSAPHRQVWIVWGGHSKLRQGSTYSALVLEEGTDLIAMVDMYSENDMFQYGQGGLTVGIQKDLITWRDIPASPFVPIINRSLDRADNDYWVFRPYVVGRNVAGCAAPGLEAVDAIMAQQLKEQNVPGMTVAASVNGRLVLTKGYGYSNVEQGRPMMSWHRAGIGSCSKVLTAAGIMKLWEDGTLPSLDAPIYLDSNILLKPYVTAGISEGIINGVHDAQDFIYFQNITVRHLLTHTSGFRGNIDDVDAANLYNNGDYAGTDYTYLIRWFLARVELGNAPGTVTYYDNENFGHLGQIIREVSGQDYEDFMLQHVLPLAGPNTMRVARVWWAEQEPIDSKRYTYYDSGMPQYPSKFDGVIRSSYYGVGKAYGPQGSWTATAADLVRFMCATDRRTLPYDVPDLLTGPTLDVMESVPFPNAAPNPFAHGWDIISDPDSADYGKLAHSGAHDAARAYMAKYPDGINVAIVVNTGKGDYSSEANQIRAIVKQAIEDQMIPVWYDLFP
jgi:CubicO group peptidase (beta-lactamase class C family)